MAVGRSAPRYQMMALLYAKSKSLQSSLSEYFTVVVRLCHHMLNLTQRSIIGQFVSSLNDSHIKGFQSELESWANSIKEEMVLSMGQKIEDEGQENSRFRALSSKFTETASHRAKLQVNLRVLDLCSTYDYETTWKQTRKRGNATLFNNATEYQNWKNRAESCTLVFRGKLGSGKSVLLANIVEDLNLHFQNKNIGLAYFFCRHDILESLKARTVIGSLAQQLLSSIPDLSIVGDLIGTSSTLDLEAISNLLHRALPHNYNMCFVLDGLDECSGLERAMVEQELRTLQTRFTLLLCISSRIEADDGSGKGYEHFATQSIISLPDDNPDIEGFISAELEHCIRSRKLEIGDPALILEIEDALLRGAQGMFLWVALQIESLCAEKTDKAIRQALEDLPKSLSETFSRILAKSLHFAESYQARILKLVTIAHHPLTTEELREALSVNPGDTNWNPEVLLNSLYSILTCCGSLVIVDEEETTVRLVHHSAKSFLLGGAENTSGVPFTTDSAHMEMADVIITYLNYGIFDTQVSRSVVPQIAAASVPSRIVHSTLASSSSVRSFALKLLKSRKQPNCDVGQILSKASKHFQSKPANQFFFYNYAKSNWLHHIRWKLENEPVKYDLLLKLFEKEVLDLDITDDRGRTPLSWAVSEESDKIVLLLLTYEKVAAELKQNIEPLWWASKSGNLILAKLMLEKGASLELSKEDEDRTVLSLAAENGHNPIVSLLLERGARLESTDTLGRTPLWWAIKAERMTMARLLLEKGADPGCMDQPPLLIAAESGHYESVKLLLEYFAPIESEDSFGRTPLSNAAMNGHDMVVKLLLDAGADIEHASRPDDQTPLSQAAEHGHDRVVEVLLKEGARTEPKGLYDLTALSYAARQGHDQVVKILVEKGAQIDSKDLYDRTALMWAAGQGYDQVLKILVEKGAQSDLQDNSGRTALIWAAGQGYDQIVKILVEKGAQSDLQDNSGRTALSWAAGQGYDQVVKILVEKGAQSDLQDNSGRTALSWAAGQGYYQVVKILVEKGAQSDLQDDSGRTALLWAIHGRHDMARELLLEKGLGCITSQGHV
jgi:ankyrin repeat protein